MGRPAADWAAELKDTGAWPLICHAIGTGGIRLDLELTAAKKLTGLGRAIDARDPDAFAAARAAGKCLGWKDSCVEALLGECLEVLAWRGGFVTDVNSVVLDEFDTTLSATPAIPSTTRRCYRIRLASLRQLLFETGVLDTPPRRRLWGAASSNASRTCRWPSRSARSCCAT
ncbi:hypothetical protein B2J88_45240 [Rhodococcus sp. SRB_17]|nr:hypothetical protein [Rhodococcus sp. SRB_17]